MGSPSPEPVYQLGPEGDIYTTPEFFLPSDEDLMVVDLPCTVHLQPPTSSFLNTGAPAAALLPQPRGSGETLPRPRLLRLPLPAPSPPPRPSRAPREAPPASLGAAAPAMAVVTPAPPWPNRPPPPLARRRHRRRPHRPRARHHRRAGLPPPAFLLNKAMEIAGAQTPTPNPNLIGDLAGGGEGARRRWRGSLELIGRGRNNIWV